MGIALKKFDGDKYGWNTPMIASMWWKTYQPSVDKLSFNDRIRINKFVSDCMATNKRDHKYYLYRTNLCQACLSQVEDEDHII
jgi:hypothetical protein